MPPDTDPLLSRLPETVRRAVQDALDSGAWIKVRRALSAFEQCPADQQGPEAGIHILSTFTVESIEPALRLGLRCLPCRAKLEVAPLNSIEQQLFDQNSTARSGRWLANVLLWRTEELLPDLFHPFSTGGPAELARKVAKLQQRIGKMVRAYLEAGLSSLFVPTIPLPSVFGGAVLNSQLGAGVAGAIARINAGIFELASLDPRVRILDVHRWSAQQGGESYDAQMDFIGRQPFKVRAAISLGMFLARNLRPLLVPRRKALAVDLDNTLWGGILGEDGLSQLKLGQDFPGNVFLRLQREIRELKHQGVLLVLLSKNEESEAREAMGKIPGMLLKWEDFAVCKVNFQPKYVNLRAAADELGLGIDSFAFLDDSDYEREQMKAFNPEVVVLNHSSDALHMLMNLLHSDAFDVHQVSEEDRHRTRDYELRAARSVKGSECQVEEFLQSLDLVARLEPVHEGNVERVVTMLGKTNQFNLTTRRHQMEQVKALRAAPGSITLTLRLSDKFGDQGIVGVLLAAGGVEALSLTVDSFLVSCRAIGRGVEDVLWAGLLNQAARAGIRRIYGDYFPTAKNGLVAALYERFGLQCLEQSDIARRFVLDGVKPVRFPGWIKVEESVS